MRVVVGRGSLYRYMVGMTVNANQQNKNKK